ncbi:MAG: DUF748 domain-containing protein [Burkholderiaceae bacterium]
MTAAVEWLIDPNGGSHSGNGGGRRPRRWPRRVLIGLLIALVLYALLGFVLLPRIARGQLEKILAEQFDRPVQVESIRFNPFKLLLKVRHVTVGPKPGDGNHDQPLFRLGALDVDAAWRSLFQLAPVVSSVRIDAPQVSLARLPDGRYSIQDLIDKWSQPSPKPSDGKVPGFAVSNIRLTNGRIDFDDQIKSLKHELAGLVIRVPFISSLEVYEDVEVEPHIEATFNGSRFAASGTTEPFSESRRSSIDIDLDDVELGELAAYSPVPLPLKVEAGRLNVDAKVLFEQPPKSRPMVNVSGSAGLAGIELRELGGEPLLKLGALTAADLDLKLQDNDFRVGSVTIDGLDAVVHRRQGQQQFFQGVLDAMPRGDKPRGDDKEAKEASAPPAPEPAASAPPTPEPAASKPAASEPASGTPLHWQVDRVALNGARLDFADQQFSPRPLAVTLDPIDVTVSDLSSEAGRPLSYKLDTKTAQGEAVSAQGQVVLAPLSVDGRFDVGQVALKNWWWLADGRVAAEPTDGVVGVNGHYQVAMPEQGLQLRLDELGVDVSKLVIVARAPGAGPAAAAASTASTAADEPAGSAAAKGAAAGHAAGKAAAGKPAAGRAAGASKGGATRPGAAAARGTAAARATAPVVPLLSIPELKVRETAVDLGAQRVVVGSVASSGGRIALRREADGRFDVQKLLVDSSSPPAGKDAAPPAAADKAAKPDWTVRLDKLQFDQYAVDVTDAKAGKTGDLKVDQLAIALGDLVVLGEQPKGSTGKLDLKARVNQRGALNVAGPLSLSPMQARLAIDARAISVLPAQPYVSEHLNAVVANGRVNAKGNLSLDLPAGQPARIHWKGDASVDDFGALARQSNRELLRWKALAVKGIDLDVQPLKLRIDDVALSQLYARVILSAEGRLNLQDLIVKDEPGAASGAGQTDLTRTPGQGPAQDAAPAASPAPAAPSQAQLPSPGQTQVPGQAQAPGQAPASGQAAGQAPGQAAAGQASGQAAAAGQASGQASAQAERKDEALHEVDRLLAFGGPGQGKAEKTLPPKPAAPPPDVRVGKITLIDANVDFSDFFVRPNYSANLTGLNGGVSQLSPEQPGDVELKGRIDNAGAVDVNGRLNPFSSALTMDIVADARDIDLPRLSPYSVKYIGHGIERGKLSAKLNYKIVDRKLTADNKVVLDQLTLGDRVADSQAPNLPVQFALALLTDRNGVIDVDLPISGSIDDPQFSIGGIVLRLIGNLIVKAITSPFSLIGGLFSGAGTDGAELSRMPFAPGAAQLEPAAIERLEKLAKVLQDRPGLKVDIAGRASPSRDRDALMHVRLQRRVKALKLKENVAEGADSARLDEISLAPDEYARLLKQLYRDAPFDKPRNVIGLTKDVPVAEMEQRLLEHMQIGDRQFQDLANRRAQAVKDWLASKGQVASERLYIVSTKIDAAEPAAPAPAAGGQPGGQRADRPPGEGKAVAGPSADAQAASGQAANGQAADGKPAGGKGKASEGIGVELNLRG